MVTAGVVAAPSAPAQAVAASEFRAGRIIDDAVFYNPGTMTVAQIQSFLDYKNTGCTTGYTCLNTYRTATRTIAATPMCATYQGADSESAAAIIYKVAQSCGINPQVLIVMLQKEQGLITARTPSAGAYRSAMGAGCPDTAACDSDYYGFFNQVQYGAYLLKRYTQPTGTGYGTAYSSRYDRMYPVAEWSSIQFNPNAACGTQSVYVENQATHSLYVYTPYTPNTAAINAGMGVGDSCSAYGNRNFFLYFSDWFGSPFSNGPPEIAARYAALGGATGVLGAATGEARIVPGGMVRDFRNGRIHWSPATGAHASYGPTAARYDALLGETGVLGFPFGEPRVVTGGQVQDFQNGRIHYSTANGAWEVVGAISKRYDELLGESGTLGYPIGAASSWNGGTRQQFQRGAIYKATGFATEALGAVATAYEANQVDLGFPTSPPRTLSSGQVQDFDRGRIHYSTATGAQVVLKDIAIRYDPLLGESGPLGYPTAARTTVGSVVSQTFQNGTIVIGTRGTWDMPTAIAARYTSVAATLGSPVAAARASGGGTVQDFENGRIHASASTGAWDVTGAVARVYDSMMGEIGTLGFPTAAATTTAGVTTPAVTTQTFQNGQIVSSARGTFAILGVVATQYAADATALGSPLAPQRVLSSGIVQDFESGRIHYTASTGARTVIAPISAPYDSLRGESGELGYPTGAKRAVPAGAVQDFQGGRIHYSPATGAWATYSAIGWAYDSVLGESGVLGFPLAGQRNVPGGTVQDFQNGRIHASASGAFPVYSPIGARYDSLMGESGVLGFPTAAQRVLSTGVVQDFRNGRIHYSAANGAWAVYGAIGAKYDQLLGESGSLGYPIAAQYSIPGGLRQDFQHGFISVANNGAVTVGQ